MDADSKTRFTDRVGDYVRYRPAYAPSIVAAILEGFDRPVVADLGAGTGISARHLSRAGATVYAIEPNSAMRRTIERSPLIIPVDGAAEATSLADASVDVVSAFQAYHWFDPARVLAEAKRILRPGGRFAAVWNTRDRNDAFTGAYEQIVDRFDSSGGRHRSPGRNDGVVEDLRARGWRNVRSYREAHVQELEADGLIGFARSASYLPRDGAAYGAMAEEMRALYERWRKPVGFAWLTEAYVAERPLE